MKRISTTLILILVLCLGLTAKGNSVFAEVDSCSAKKSWKVNRLTLDSFSQSGYIILMG